MIGAILQARMSSQRLPGKVLRSLGGKPALTYMLETLSRCRALDAFLVATSTEPSDDPIAELCGETVVVCHRGPLDDVAKRFLEVCELHGLDAFVRLTGDSPLLDYRVVDRAVELFEAASCDVVSNVHPRSTYPSGQSVEVVSVGAFKRAFEKMDDPEEHEHVTLHFYRNPESFSIAGFDAPRDDGDVDISLDTEQDAILIEAVLARMDPPHWEYTSEQIVDIYREVVAAGEGAGE